ncbi:alpha/beta hydrolase [Microbacterium proteolyticum]|uniref:alpha/beta hydrolase n=1 Tax=Microbacterium proteolyticum TaxID=1572644 RepID=UPI001FAD742B|nr:alpha/beta hydrolase [Microbacterium proteolyticum]MCI9857114.1 alpha/beta hydrolase [Microbacterium proteolyticum]
MNRIAAGAMTVAGTIGLICVIASCSPSRPQETPDPAITVENDIPYPGADGGDLQADACLPTSSGPHPAVVLVHGGAFKEGDRGTMSRICRALGDQGFAAFAVDYRLLPSTYPAQVEDVMASVQWLRDPAQAERFNLSRSVSILGSSAGAIIALSAAEQLRSASAPVDAVVALSPAGSLTADAAQLGDPRPDLEQVVQEYLGCDDLSDCAIAGEASPATSADLLPPTLIIHGSDELIPLQQAQLLDQSLQTAGVIHDLIVVDGQKHGLQLLNNDTRAGIVRFLSDHSS